MNMLTEYWQGKSNFVHLLGFNIDACSAAMLLTSGRAAARLFAPYLYQFWLYLPANFTQDAIAIFLLNLSAFFVLRKSSSVSQEKTPCVEDAEKSFLLNQDEEDDTRESESYDDSNDYAVYRAHKASIGWQAVAFQLFVAVLSLLAQAFAFSSIVIHSLFDKNITWPNMIQAYTNYNAIKGFAPTFGQLILPLFGYIVSISLIIIALTGIRVLTTFTIPKRILQFLALLFVALAIFVRPITSPRTGNILFSLVRYTFSHLKPHSRKGGQSGTDIYGKSNIGLPLDLAFMQDPSIQHIFIIALESINRNAAPYQPSFCVERSCDDMDSKFNNAEHFTPFLAKLKKESLSVENFMTTTAFSTKSKGAVICGDFFSFTDFLDQEAATGSFRLPCLPKLMPGRWGANKTKTLDVQGFRYAWDHGDVVGDMQGFDQLWDRVDYSVEQDIDPGNEWDMVPDQAAVAHILDFLDEQIAAGNNTLAAFHTSNQHWPWALPNGKTPYLYSNQSAWDVIHYLNVLPITDDSVRLLVEGLGQRGVLDKSAIVIFGDHGSRITDYGEWSEERASIQDLQTPLFIRTNKTAQWARENQEQLSISADRLVYALDIVPTVLDILEADPQMISAYPGQSMLRASSSRYTFHSQMPGGEDIATLSQDGKWAVLRKNALEDYCIYRLEYDPQMKYGYCPDSGYQGWLDAPKNFWVDAHTFLSEEEITEMLAFLHTAIPLIEEHQELNAEYYRDGTLNAAIQKDFLTKWQSW